MGGGRLSFPPPLVFESSDSEISQIWLNWASPDQILGYLGGKTAGGENFELLGPQNAYLQGEMPAEGGKF